MPSSSGPARRRLAPRPRVAPSGRPIASGTSGRAFLAKIRRFAGAAAVMSMVLPTGSAKPGRWSRGERTGRSVPQGSAYGRRKTARDAAPWQATVHARGLGRREGRRLANERLRPSAPPSQAESCRKAPCPPWECPLRLRNGAARARRRTRRPIRASSASPRSGWPHRGLSVCKRTRSARRDPDFS